MSTKVRSVNEGISEKPNYILIETLEESKKTVESIQKNEKIIAIDCEGINLSKNGELTLIQIGLKDGKVYIFDILKGGNSMFTGISQEDSEFITENGTKTNENDTKNTKSKDYNISPKNPRLTSNNYSSSAGLKSLFENKNITKLIHDCRNDWDSILYQYNTRFYNFIDTQEAFFIYELFYLNVINLPISLSNFIQKFTDKDLVHKNEVKNCMSQDVNFWAIRPMPSFMLNYACDDVRYLIKAYSTIKEKMNNNLVEIIFFLSIFKCIQKESFFDFKLYLNSTVFKFLNKKNNSSQLFNFNYCYSYMKLKISNKMVANTKCTRAPDENADNNISEENEGCNNGYEQLSYDTETYGNSILPMYQLA